MKIPLHVCLCLAILISICGQSIAFVGPPRLEHQTRLFTSKNNNKATRLQAGEVLVFADGVEKLSDYAPAATSLFNNMKLPAAVVTAGMISLGFATTFPELPPDNAQRQHSLEERHFCEKLKRLHIVVALISVTSELIAVLWAAVEVNQLTERVFAPTGSVWELIQRDCDLAWSAVNSHFVIGIIGFVIMLSLRAYVMLIASQASQKLMSAATTGTLAALCLMISVVNRAVQAGGGAGVGYGGTIFDLLQHYAVLLFQMSTNFDGPPGPGPLQFVAIVLEIASLVFVIQVLWVEDGDKFQQKQTQFVEQEEIPPLMQQSAMETLPITKKSEKEDEGRLSLIPSSPMHESQTIVNGYTPTSSVELSEGGSASAEDGGGGAAGGDDGGASSVC